MIKFARERLDDVSDEITPLLDRHWEEIALNKDKIKLKPDWGRYRTLDELGHLAIYTLRDDERLVGYFVCFVMPHIHYCDDVFAVNDIIYFDKDYRKGMNAIRFLKYCEKDLADNGVSAIVINSKEHQPFGRVLERIGYNFTEKIFTKVLI